MNILCWICLDQKFNQREEIYLEIKNADNPSHWNIHENNSCGDIIVALKVNNAEEICTAEKMVKVLMVAQSSCTWHTTSDRIKLVNRTFVFFLWNWHPTIFFFFFFSFCEKRGLAIASIMNI